MPLAYLFWLCVFLWLLATVGGAIPAWNAQRGTFNTAGNLLAFIAIVCLGWATFGDAVK